jgi:hypothetical protein
VKWIITIFSNTFTIKVKRVLGMEHGKSINGKEEKQALIKAYRDADNFS